MLNVKLFKRLKKIKKRQNFNRMVTILLSLCFWINLIPLFVKRKLLPDIFLDWIWETPIEK
jgi:hypothetical protein